VSTSQFTSEVVFAISFFLKKGPLAPLDLSSMNSDFLLLAMMESQSLFFAPID